MSGKARAFCFTLNNYTDEDCVKISKIYDKYVIYGMEVGEQGTKHLQGYIIFKNPRSFTAIAKLLKWHIEISKGSFEANFKYCTKSGVFVELGERPIMGERCDLKTIKEDIKEGKPWNEVLEGIENYQQLRFAEGLRKYYHKSRDIKTKVTWVWGPTGTGKSRWAAEEGGSDVYWALADGKWWDGYVGQNTVIIDDMRKDFMKFHEILRLFDRYPLTLQVKGGTTEMLATHIIVTTTKPPQTFWEGRSDEDIQQLLRRIENVIFFGTGTEVEGNTKPRPVHEGQSSTKINLEF